MEMGVVKMVMVMVVMVIEPLSRELVGTVYRRGGTTQGKDVEITMEEMQRQLGLGVDCG